MLLVQPGPRFCFPGWIVVQIARQSVSKDGVTELPAQPTGDRGLDVGGAPQSVGTRR